MKTIHWIGVSAAALVAALCFAPVSQADDVLQLTISAKGFKQSGSTVETKKVTSQKIVNAALDIDPDSNDNASPSRVLAVVVKCTDISDIVIWDTIGGVPVSTIGTVDLRSTVAVSNLSYAAIMDLMFVSTNRLLSSVNGVDSDLTAGTKGLLKVNNCFGVFSGKFDGNFNYVGAGGNTNSLLIIGGKVSAGVKLGTVP